MANRMRDAAKERFWRDVLKRAARSDLSVRAFCRRERLAESDFYAWRRTIAERGRELAKRPGPRQRTPHTPSFLPLRVTDGAPVAGHAAAASITPKPNANTVVVPKTVYDYDSAGNVERVSDALGHATVYGHDKLNRLTTKVDPPTPGYTNSTTVYQYDAASQLQFVTTALAGSGDGFDHTTEYKYDNLGRLFQQIDPDIDGAGSLARPVTEYRYNDYGSLTRLIDPAGNTTTSKYDNLNRLEWEKNSLNKSRVFTYDEAGNTKTVTDRNGHVRVFSYDEIGRRTTDIWMHDQTIVNLASYKYDISGRLRSAGDGSSLVTYDYDHQDRVKTTTQLVGNIPVELTNEYDALGRREFLSAKIGGAKDFRNQYIYDDASRLSSVHQQSQTSGNAVAEKMSVGAQREPVIGA